MKQTRWININKVTEIISKATDKKNYGWSWLRNSRCKYINIRVDMRDGSCILFDRDNSPINLKALEYQCAEE